MAAADAASSSPVAALDHLGFSLARELCLLVAKACLPVNLGRAFWMHERVARDMLDV
jgi:hypothetical protein